MKSIGVKHAPQGSVTQASAAKAACRCNRKRSATIGETRRGVSDPPSQQHKGKSATDCFEQEAGTLPLITSAGYTTK